MRSGMEDWWAGLGTASNPWLLKSRLAGIAAAARRSSNYMDRKTERSEGLQERYHPALSPSSLV